MQQQGGAMAAALRCTPAHSRHFAARHGGTLMLVMGGVGKVGGGDGEGDANEWGMRRCSKM